jgi:hypothetical protein
MTEHAQSPNPLSPTVAGERRLRSFSMILLF